MDLDTRHPLRTMSEADELCGAIDEIFLWKAAVYESLSALALSWR